MADAPQFFGYRQPEADLDVTWGELAGASLRQANDMYNMWEMATRREEAPDLNFDASIEGQKSDLWDRHSDTLVQARNPLEFRDLERRLRQREEDLSVIASQDWLGFVMAGAAGIASPTALIPFVGQARGAKGVAQAFALAAAASAAQEAPIALNQMQGFGETALNIGAGTVIGGLMGSTAVVLRGRTRARMEADLASDSPDLTYHNVEVDASGRIRVGDDLEDMETPAEMGRGPRPLDSDNPSYFDTRGEGQRFHGTQNDLPEGPLMDYYGSELNYYGQGFYTTDAISIADGYSKGSKNIYQLFERPGVKAFDMEQEIPDFIRTRFQGAGGTSEELFEEALGRNPKNVRELFDEIRDLSGDYELSADSVQGIFQDILNGIETQGFNALDHKGGLRTGKSPHSVRIYMTPSQHLERERVRAEDFQPRQPEPASAGGGSLSAASTDARFVPEDASDRARNLPNAGMIAPMGPEVLGADRVLAKVAATAPAVRLIQQPNMVRPSQVTRDLTQRLTDAGLMMESNAEGIATAPGGTVEARLGYYHGLTGRALKAQYEAYLGYLKDGKEAGALDRIGANANILVGRAPKGKMSFTEFKEAVTDARNLPGAPADPHVRAFADSLKKDFFDPITEQAMDATEQRGAKALYAVREENDLWGYMSHVYAPEKIVANKDRFIQIVSQHYLAKATDYYTKKVLKLSRYRDENDELRTIAELSHDEALEEMERIREAIKRAPEAADLDPRVDQIRMLRDQARELVEEAEEKYLQALPEVRREEPQAKKDAKTEAKFSTKEQVKALRDQADELEAALPKSVFKVKEDKAKLRKQLRNIGESFGAYEEKRAALLANITKGEDMNLRALDRVQRATTKFLKAMAKVDDRTLAKELKKLSADLEADIMRVERGRTRLAKMDEAAPASYERESGRQLSRHLAEMKTMAKLQATEGIDREGIRALALRQLEDTKAHVAEVVEARARRNQRMLDKSEKFNPDIIKRRLEAQDAKLAEKETNLDKELSDAGATNINLRTGAFDFTELSEEMARKLTDKILGNYTRIGQFDVLPDLRGPMKHRLLDIPYDQKREFLELDSERLLARYADTMGSDIELFRAYGDVAGKTALTVIKEDMERIEKRIAAEFASDPAKKAKLLLQHEKAAKQYYQTFEGLIERVRGLRGIGGAKTNIGHRLGRLAMNWNVATMMGGVTISSLADPHRAITAYGLNHTFRSSWVPYVKSMVGAKDDKKYIKESFRQLRLMNIGLDTWTQARGRGALDLLQPDPFASRIERAAEKFSASMPFLAAYGPWTDGWKLITGTASMARFVDAIHNVAEGRKGNDIQFLAAAGLDEPLVRRIWHEMNTGDGSTDFDGIKVPNSGSWEDRQAARAFEAAMFRESERLIVSPGLEKPLIMDSHILMRVITQFQSFAFASQTKMLAAAMQSRGVLGSGSDAALRHTLEGFISSLGLGWISYYVWAMASGEEAREEMRNVTWQQAADQALARSGYLGAFSIVQNVAAAIPATAPFTTFGAQPLAGRRAEDIMGSVLGPTYGTLQTASRVLAGIDQPTESTVHQARKLMPYQNVAYLKEALNWVETGVTELFNLPERRTN